MSILDSVPVVGSYRKSKEADEIVARWKRNHKRAESELEEANEASKELCQDLLETKIICATDVIPAASDVLEKCHKINRKETNVKKDSYISLKRTHIPSLKESELTFGDVAKTGVKGTAAGAALALGSMSTVSAVGTASTGTAIATLSGAAAQNATLAWFGGGALSAGGAGIAGGAMVLGGVALAPIAVLGAIKYSSHAEKKLTDAKVFRNKVRENIEKIEATIDISKSLNDHVDLYHNTIKEVSFRLDESRQSLNLALDEKDEEKIKYFKVVTILLIKALKRLLDIVVINQSQQPSAESLMVIEHANSISDVVVEEFIQEFNSSDSVELPEGVNYLREILPGGDSIKYFWLQGDYDEKPKPKKIKANSENKLTFYGTIWCMVLSFILALGFASFNFEFLSILLFWLTGVYPLSYIGQKFGGKVEQIAGLMLIIITGVALMVYF